MRIFNTYSRSLEDLEPLNRGRIRMFVCGPTVYDYIHVGNARTFIIFDSFAKYLSELGYEVFYLQNITDVDDKIINRARELDMNPEDLSEKFYREFRRDMRSLRVDSVSLYAKATLYIDEIIGQISALLEKGFAYESDDGVYFSVRKFRDFGKLSGQDMSQIRHGVRIDLNENKRDPEDFVLWKKHREGEPYWDSPWGPGRPGWHIEDTAITSSFFGDEYDIHGGAVDLIFPHHEAEIAQMRSISGKEFLSRYWIHSGLLRMGEEKMSKSLGNFVKVREALSKYTGEQLRFFLLNSRYSSDLLYSDELIASSNEALSRIQNAYTNLLNITAADGTFTIDSRREIDNFKAMLDSNFDTRSVFARLLEIVTEINRNTVSISRGSADEILLIFDFIDRIFGILRKDESEYHVSRLIESIISMRQEFRKEKDFRHSDMIRKILEDSGIRIEDSGKEVRWRIG
ncbi:MAG: cysteine--tRNA ligase [Thermoplasmata archaeon]